MEAPGFDVVAGNDRVQSRGELKGRLADSVVDFGIEWFTYELSGVWVHSVVYLGIEGSMCELNGLYGIEWFMARFNGLSSD
jgi:hypothetical protein